MSSAEQHEFDILVVGGGLVGGPLALALSMGGWRVGLIERGGPVAIPEDPLDQQCTALSAGSVSWLCEQGLWFPAESRASVIQSVHVSQRGQFGAVRLGAGELGLDAMGEVVENRCCLSALGRVLDASEVQLWRQTAVDTIQCDDRWAQVGGMSRTDPFESEAEFGSESGHRPLEVRARLLVGVDGVQSNVRDAVGIATHEVDYQQAAVLCTVALDRDHGNVAYERFTDTGPLALLPRPECCANVVECIEPAGSEQLAGLDDDGYCRHLQQRFGFRLGRFRRVGRRQIVPLRRVEARSQVAPRTLLLGNAARLLHPVAGQGYNLALRDVAAFVNLLGPAPSTGGSRADPGAPSLLAEFLALRRRDQSEVVGLTDLLARGFRGRNRALASIRSMGLLGLDSVSPLRRRFARRSMGLGG